MTDGNHHVKNNSLVFLRSVAIFGSLDEDALILMFLQALAQLHIVHIFVVFLDVIDKVVKEFWDCNRYW